MPDAVAAPTVTDLLSALRASHARLVAALAPLGEEDLSRTSYADEWTIAQVASHLGSGAEIFGLFVEAGLDDTSLPGMEVLQPIWDRWNGKPPAQQAGDAVAADAALLDSIDALDDAQRGRWRLDMFGTEQSLAGLLQMRLAEHAVHTWDIAVTLDPTATVADDAVTLIVDTVPRVVERAGKPSPEPLTIQVDTSDPDRRLRLELSAEGARVSRAEAEDPPSAVLTLPAEAWVRLVYGRLDADHTPGTVTTQSVDLDLLRRCFPGF
jgi:uncharacterized protein (TIGR03083 family)